MVVLDYSDSVVRFIFVVSLVSHWGSRLSPFLLLLGGNDQRVFDEFRVSESSNLLRFERTVSGQILKRTGEDIDFDPEVVDYVTMRLP
jgi:hypothetical protein